MLSVAVPLGQTAQVVIADLQQQVAAEKNDKKNSPQGTSISILSSPLAGAGAASVEENETGGQAKLGKRYNACFR